jgi:hypothetical protein
MLDHRALRAHTIRRAMLQPDRYLAAALGEIPDVELASAIGALPGQVWRLRLCGYPRADRWAEDLQAMADLVDAVPLELKALLQQVGIAPPRPGG